jgi:hypothetical protein
MLGSRNILRPDRAFMSLDGSPEERAERLLGDPGWFDSWERAARIDVSGVSAPFAVEVDAQSAVFDLSTDSLAVALLWGDAETVGGGPIEIQAGQTGVIQVSRKLSDRLEVWTSGGDFFASARIVSKSEGEQTAREEKADNADKYKPKLPDFDLDPSTILIGALVLATLAFAVVKVR